MSTDVHTSRPDKKSIMMYVMCLFQALPHGAEDALAAPLAPPAEATAADAEVRSPLSPLSSLCRVVRAEAGR